jgi:K+-transporting ATPase A subunit
MKQNLGSADRVIRLVVAALLTIFYFAGFITGTLGIVGLIIAAVFVLTSIVGTCPLYMVFGINSCGLKRKQS